MRIPVRQVRGPIGLDIGSRMVKAVQLSGSPAAWRLAAATLIPRESDGPVQVAELHRLRDVLERQGFTGDRVVISVPEKQLVSAILELPPKTSGAPVDQIARMELASMHKLDPQGFEMSSWDLPSTGRARETARVMAVALKHDDADAALAAFEAAGLEVAAMDVQLAALARICDATGESQQEITAVLDIGWTSAALGILHGGVIVYERRLREAALKPLADHLTNGFELDDDVVDYLLTDVGLKSSRDDEAIASQQLADIQAAISDHFSEMVSELSVSFSYATHQYGEAAFTKLMLTGGGAAIPGLREHIAQQTGMEAAVITPGDRAEVPAALAVIGAAPILTAAAGLAMHPTGEA